MSGVEKAVEDQGSKADKSVVGLSFFLMGMVGWGTTDLLFGHALLSICGGVITACLFWWLAYRAAMRNWGDKI